MAQFSMKTQWSIMDPNEIQQSLRPFMIEYYRQGVIVYCGECAYYLRRKHNRMACVWKLFSNQLPQSVLSKCIANGGNGEIYCSSEFGNLYHMEVLSDNVSFNAILANNENNLDFVILNGSREDYLILLTTKHTLKAMDMSRYLVYSTFEIPDANAIFAHNASPSVIVGTTTGLLHFINYNNIREPEETSRMATEHNYPIVSVQLKDVLGVYRTVYNHFYLVQTDSNREKCYEICPIVNLNEKEGICKYFLADNNYIFIFVNQKTELVLPHCNALWCFQWLPVRSEIRRQDYQLPEIYRDVSAAVENQKDVFEFYAVRLESNIIDCLQLNRNESELSLVYRIQTVHLSNICGIVGSSNLMTWGVDGTYVHYRSHKKSSKPYGMCQVLQIKYRPRVVQKVVTCSNAK